jgi:creatinine amidohydrolase
MRHYVLSETNWKTVRERDYDLAVLPWGATEAHNYHLPYGTDNIETEKIAIESARLAWEKEARVIVLPTIPFGVNTGQKDIRLTMNLNPSTQAIMLSDIVESLIGHRIYKFLIMNGHGGNDFKQMIRELGYRYPQMFISTCLWQRRASGRLKNSASVHSTKTGPGPKENGRKSQPTPVSEIPRKQAGKKVKSTSGQ